MNYEHGFFPGNETPSPEEWNFLVDRFYQDFPKGGAEGTLPPHFLRATFQKIGGRLIHVQDENLHCWISFLPGTDRVKRDWTLRVNYPVDFGLKQKAQAESRLQEWIAAANVGEDIFVFDVSAKRQEEFLEKEVFRFNDGIWVSHPSSLQARASEHLHRRVWNVEDLAFLYPYDLYHPESGLATQLVASQDHKVIGFLFGFYGKGKQWFGADIGFQNGQWVESQLLAVDPPYRRIGLAKRLKFIQREQALQEGIDLIHWTVDPLQAGNAFLNFNQLGAVSAQFYPDYYVFRNDLNRITPSRIGMSWMLNSDRACSCVAGEPVDWDVSSLLHDSGVETISPPDLMPESQSYNDSAWIPQGERVLVEIPADWNKIQSRENIDMVITWRTTSDLVFRRLLVGNGGNYTLIGAVRDLNRERVYLIADKV